MLVEVLLPVVQPTRKAARTMPYNHPLRQMALVGMNHETALKKFPSEGWDDIESLRGPGGGFETAQPGG